MEGFAEANSLIKELAALRAFHDFFWDRYENLFAHFGAEAIDLYNAADAAERNVALCPVQMERDR